jgi:hypothetical protein
VRPSCAHCRLNADATPVGMSRSRYVAMR